MRTCPDHMIPNVRGAHVLIAGAGREAASAVRHLHQIAGSIVVSEDDPVAAARWNQQWGSAAPAQVSPDLNTILAGVDLLLISPGIPPSHPLRVAALTSQIPTTTPTGLYLANYAATTIGVTGSKGKSTTASLIAHLLNMLGCPTALGGNIGLPALDLPPTQVTVLELSSYQCSTLPVSPHIVVVTSLFPDHLNWHGSLAAYYQDKLHILDHNPTHVLLAPDDLTLGEQVKTRTLPTTKMSYTLREHLGTWTIYRETHPLINVAELSILGLHNARNATLALNAVTAHLGYTPPDDQVHRALTTFQPLPHRLEEIPDPAGQHLFIDDTLSTSPQATIAALEALTRTHPEKPITLIVGGLDRGVDYTPLIKHLVLHPVHTVIGLPEVGHTITDAMTSSHTIVKGEDLPEAVAQARKLTPPGGLIVLSPAASSYNAYLDFEDKATHFRLLIDSGSDDIN
jgi:UDP-N-acetylmuramoyl-L-alanine---L-glutamate ligase